MHEILQVYRHSIRATHTHTYTRTCIRMNEHTCIAYTISHTFLSSTDSIQRNWADNDINICENVFQHARLWAHTHFIQHSHTCTACAFVWKQRYERSKWNSIRISIAASLIGASFDWMDDDWKTSQSAYFSVKPTILAIQESTKHLKGFLIWRFSKMATFLLKSWYHRVLCLFLSKEIGKRCKCHL